MGGATLHLPKKMLKRNKITSIKIFDNLEIKIDPIDQNKRKFCKKFFSRKWGGKLENPHI